MPSKLGYPLSKQKTSPSFLRVPSNNSSRRSFRPPRKNSPYFLYAVNFLGNDPSLSLFLPFLLPFLLSSFNARDTRRRPCVYIYIFICVCVSRPRVEKTYKHGNLEIRRKRTMHTWYVEGIALKIVDGFWTTTRIVANPISLRYFSIFTFFSNDYSSVTFPFLRNIILEFLFFFVPFSFFFLFDLARIVRPREIPPQFVAPSTDSSTNLNARADRRSTGPVYHPAQRRVLSGSVSYRVGRARPFMPTDFQTRTERAPTYTTRACAWTKMAVV